MTSLYTLTESTEETYRSAQSESVKCVGNRSPLSKRRDLQDFSIKSDVVSFRNGRVVIVITGTAKDTGGGVVGGVEVTVDGGVTWRQATGREEWQYEHQIHPVIVDEEEGKLCPNLSGGVKTLGGGTSRNDSLITLQIMTRAVDDSGWLENIMEKDYVKVEIVLC